MHTAGSNDALLTSSYRSQVSVTNGPAIGQIINLGIVATIQNNNISIAITFPGDTRCGQAPRMTQSKMVIFPYIYVLARLL